MPKTIRIYFLHKTILTLEDSVKYLGLDTQKYNFVWDAESPDYLFVSEHIYLKKKIYKRFLSMLYGNTWQAYAQCDLLSEDSDQKQSRNQTD